MKFNKSKPSAFNYSKKMHNQRLKHILSKTKSCVGKEYTIIKKLGAGCCGTVYEVNADINGEPLNIVQKTFISGKTHERINDDFIEL